MVSTVRSDVGGGMMAWKRWPLPPLPPSGGRLELELADTLSMVFPKETPNLPLTMAPNNVHAAGSVTWAKAMATRAARVARSIKAAGQDCDVGIASMMTRRCGRVGEKLPGDDSRC